MMYYYITINKESNYILHKSKYGYCKISLPEKGLFHNVILNVLVPKVYNIRIT